MNLGISSLGHVIELGLSGKYESLSNLLLEASEAGLKFSEEYKFEVCELILDPPEIFSDDVKQQFVEMCNSYSIKKQIHGPFIDMGMCSHNKKISDASVESYIETVKICQEIDAQVLTVHPGLANFLINTIKGFNKRRLIEATNALLDSVKDYDITICMENMPFNTNILLNENEIEEFFVEMNRDDIFFTYDTSHFWTCDGNVEKLWEKIHERIKNVHVVENSSKETDKHQGLGTGKINFKEIFDVIKKYDYKGALIIELSQAKELPDSIEFIKQFL